MLIRIRRGWEIPESQATPESAYLSRQGVSRRALLAGLGVAGLGAALPAGRARAAAAGGLAPDLYPAKRNPKFTLDRELTSEKVATSYNNFYEFNSSKYVADQAQKLSIQPWQVKIDGMVEKEITVDAEELIRKMPVEERLYRHRCVEAWSMAVPWSGFALSALVDYAKPLSGATYLQMQTFQKPEEAPGQRQFWYPWPYIEGLTMAEARNELAFIATGVYGKPIPKQMGAPLRLAVPWKYGFKSIKSIVKFTFTDKRPKNFWQAIGPDEYGFWANVNPAVPHPRWGQDKEELIGTGGKRVPTQIYNGYGEFVADLYKDMPKQERLFM
jgi:sulfoxide reductase catalytic subunit YedY